MESAEIISPLMLFASCIAKAVFPTAVGPTIKITLLADVLIADLGLVTGPIQFRSKAFSLDLGFEPSYFDSV